MTAKYLLAEYCEGPFYMGWWLYLRDRNDGSPNDDHEWGWQRGDSPAWVHGFCKSLGYDPPPHVRCSDNLAEWFAGTFPNGLLIETEPLALVKPGCVSPACAGFGLSSMASRLDLIGN